MMIIDDGFVHYFEQVDGRMIWLERLHTNLGFGWWFQ